MAGPGGGVSKMQNAEDAQRLTLNYVKNWRQKNCNRLVRAALDEIELKALKGCGRASLTVKDEDKQIYSMFIHRMRALGFEVSFDEVGVYFVWMDANQLEPE